MTLMLLHACIDAKLSPRFVYLSSTGTNDETTNAYRRARAEVEAALRSNTVPYVIARPATITGDRDEHRAMESFAAGAGDMLLGVVGALGGKKLRDRYRSTTNVILARNLVRAALDPKLVDVVLESESLRE